MKDILSRVQRELPDTDRDRYDIAYERGRAQARSGLLLGGLVIGSALGAAMTWLFDPDRGRGRRAELASRAEGLKNDLARTTSGRTKDLGNRIQGFAIERGLKEPPADEWHERERPPAEVPLESSRVDDVAVFEPSTPPVGATSSATSEGRVGDH